jgi:cell pole-organizing protein PopZ
LSKGVAVGDISNETSMEDILSSIKRIIAEEGEGSAQALRGRKSIRTAQVRDLDDSDEVLELNQSVAAPPPPPRVEMPAVEAPRAERLRRAPVEPQPEAVAPPPPEPPAPAPAQASTVDASIVSDRAAEASRGSLDQLSRMLVKPETPGADSLEGLVRDMLRPMLREWLDAKLPGIVETMVSKEIARISGRE